MSATATGVGVGGVPDSPIGRFLGNSEEHIQDLLITHRIPPEDTEELLQQALGMLVYRWGELGDPKAWLSAMLTAHCQRYWRRRGVPAAGSGRAPAPSPGSAGTGAAILDFERPERP